MYLVLDLSVAQTSTRIVIGIKKHSATCLTMSTIEFLASEIVMVALYGYGRPER